MVNTTGGILKVSSAKQVHILIAILLLVGFSAAIYKHLVLGFPLLASEKETVWQLEARIVFEAEPETPVEVRLNLPDNNPQSRIFALDSVAVDYNFSIVESSDFRYARWLGKNQDGPQILYFRALSHEPDAVDAPGLSALNPMKADFNEVLLKSAKAFIAEKQLSQGINGALELMRRLNTPNNERVNELLRGYSSSEKRNLRMGQLLTLAGFKVEPVGGIFLNDETRSQNLTNLLEIDIDGHRWLLDSREIAILPWDEVVILQRSNQPLLEVFGGANSRVSFAATKTQQAAFSTAVDVASREGNALVDFSIYSLPLSEQNVFKLLLVIPLGALVVVILRNLVGIRTSGTFMPVLIALTFLQTSLLTGIMLFVVVVGVGLILRGYLSHLNLLLVPRIASVLVFVIIIYGAIGILSTKLGWHEGLKVTFFPMIILSWTIERMSILWDEDGPHEVMIESGGSLLTASLAYLLMSNSFVSDTIFLYPELLLVLLAIIIAIGSYTGYRLSELRRFEPMERHDQ